MDIGGVETGVVDLAKYLILNGHKAVVVSSGGRLVKELDNLGARHYTLPVHRKNVFNIIKMAREVRDIIREENIDLLHARSRVPAWIAFFASKAAKRPLVTTAHGYYSKHPASEVMGWGRLVIVASNVMARHMVHDFGVPHTRIRFVPRGVDLARFKFRPLTERRSGEFTVGMVSRITPLKGHPDFLKAMSVLSRNIPHLKVIIAGGVPKGKEKYLEELELLTRRLGLSRTVEFIGVQENVPALLENMDALVLATVTQEAFGRSIIEAQAAGVPVVATRVGGVVDIIEDGVNGILCNPEDPKDMSQGVLRIYRDKALAERLSCSGRKNVEERFTLDRMAADTVKIYEEAMRQLNILVIKISSVGDCILSMPSLAALRSAYPSCQRAPGMPGDEWHNAGRISSPALRGGLNKEASIKVLVGLAARDVFNNCPYIDDRIVCDFKGKDKSLSGIWRLGAILRKENLDMVVDLQNNKTSHLLAFLSLANLRYGYDNKKWSFFLNKKVRDDNIPIDPIEHQARTLKEMGISGIKKALELFPSEDDDRWARDFLKSNWAKPGQPIVGIHLRASAKWLTKNWPIDYIAQLCDRLAIRNIRTVVTGTKDDIVAAGSLLKRTKSKPILACGKTSILGLAALMKYLSVFVTPDSAPMHMASAMGTPVIGLFGPTDPKRHFVPSGKSVAIVKGLDCAPCYSPHCLVNFKCMKKIGVDEVLDAVEKVLKK